MRNLDSEKEIKDFDKGKVLESVKRLPDQVEQAWAEIKELDIPKACAAVNNVVVCGMGGSALGGRIVDSLVVDRVRTPIEIVSNYDVPNYVGPKSLVLVTSYSGNTEETISAAHKALIKKAEIFGITTGGKLAEFLRKEKIPAYIYEPKENPSNQPRLGLGYSVAATMAILAKCGFITFAEEDIKSALVSLRKFSEEFDSHVPENKNLAKRMAVKLKGKIPILVASEHLVGALHAFKNLLNEGAKTFSASFDIPELNHHLMEGLRNPATAKEHLFFLFFESKLYSSGIRKRYPITQEVVEKNEIDYSVYQLRSSKKIEQIFEVLSFASFVHFYLAFVYGVDPLKIPWVDYFKEKLAKS
jgi:glucose/mannose-6-phosphate isomerase